MASTPRRTFRLDLAYDGAPFAGFARQPGLPTVEGELVGALTPLAEGRSLCLAAGGRTDRGVHAVGQVVSFKLPTTISPDTLWQSLSNLPEGLAPLRLVPAPHSFHARFSARYRHYSYFMDPPADLRIVTRMDHMLTLLQGRRCFMPFSRDVPAHKSTMRHLQVARARLAHLGRSTSVRFDFIADGFLRKQVRVIVATALRSALADEPADALLRIAASGDRNLTALPAAPGGLYLSFIGYG
jgi:tRNA pseudouridine38-40 synthase